MRGPRALLALIVLLASVAVAAAMVEGEARTSLVQEWLAAAMESLAAGPEFRQAEVASDAVLVNVTTAQGVVTGVEENGCHVFRGIPYGDSTAGDYRWQAPRPEPAWDGALDCTQFRAACPQKYTNATADTSPYVTVPLSEDCLHLNVWAPAHAANTSLPVMVWIHGGAYVFGWSGDALFWPDYMINSTEAAIVVSIEYRVGALGFLATEQLAGNYGFLDQQLALAWVQQNIAAFGGNPASVTLFGQSAGAMSVMLHTIAPSSKGLFDRVIMESNPLGILYRTPEEAQPAANHLASLVDCDISDLACLRAVSWQEVVAEQTKCITITIPVASSDFFLFFPVIDGDVIPGQPVELLKQGAFDKSLSSSVWGTCRNETIRFLPDISLPAELYELLVDLIFFTHAPSVLRQYPATEGGDNLNQLAIMSTDWLFVCASRAGVRSFANAGIPSYLYQFLHHPSDDPINSDNPTCAVCSPFIPAGASPLTMAQYGVCHSAEIPFVFHSDGFVSDGSMTSAELDLSWSFVDYWVNAANGAFSSGSWGPAWPLYSASGDESLVFNLPDVHTMEGYHSSRCDFWDSLGYVN